MSNFANHSYGETYMEDYLEINRRGWDARTRIHLNSRFYDVPGFLGGNSSLNCIELAAIGDDVTGKSLLHLQCHFGLDTLSWARLGASVTGLDLSCQAIEQATALTRQTGLEASFVCADVYRAQQVLQRQFDIVFSSYGALCWLPDLDLWAQTVQSCLKPGGIFYLAEFHPVQGLLAGYRYFHTREPDIEEEGSYTENAGDSCERFMSWSHSLADVIGSLLRAGLQLIEFKEFDFSPYNCFEGLEEVAEGCFQMRHGGQTVPMVYSIKALKP
ncbi:class I SAM-dependent methyltransferase [Shewanella sp. GXUN23E]|uniref:class I SAM-dependent methyltransferase n=1 Tax=Shewanella sp. GXUN23E TaxID=3422498 RepID=UPI003D7D4114